MATLTELRTRVRLRLEESSAAVWTDNELDEGITATLDHYNLLYLKQAAAAIEVAAGDLELTLPAGAVRVERVTLATGYVVPRRGRPEGWTADEAQAWEQWAGEIRFTAALDAGDVTVWYLVAHDVEDVEGADAALLVAGAVWRALQQRAVQDIKRGNTRGVAPAVVSFAESEWRQMWDARGRRVRGSLVQRN